MIKLFPSTNPSPEENLLHYINVLQEAGIEFIHCDVMDGIFVKNSCLDIQLLNQIATETTVGLDVHLMITEPLSNIEKYIKLPATYITTHYEAYNTIQNIIKMSKYIRNNNKLMGLAIKPSTPISKIKDLLSLCDLILIMSVEPGESGQVFMESAYDKIRELKQEIVNRNLKVKIQVDGGINENNMQKVVNAGADILVMGNAVFIANDRAKLVKSVKLLYKQNEQVDN